METELRLAWSEGRAGTGAGVEVGLTNKHKCGRMGITAREAP